MISAQSNPNTALLHAVSYVFEQMAFMFAETADQALPLPQKAMCAQIQFTGPQEGNLKLIASQQVCIELAANTLGIESEDVQVPSHIVDALKELTNVICGQFITTFFGTQPMFQLSIPQVVSISTQIWEKFANIPGALRVLLDEGPVIAQISLGDKHHEHPGTGCR